MIIWEQTHRRILNIIHTKNSPKYKLSNEASCLAPNKTTKNSKKIQVWERGSCVVCGVNGALPLLIYYFYGQFGDKLGNLPNWPPSALMIPPEEAGPDWQRQGCGRTLGAAIPKCSCLTNAFLWLGSEWAWEASSPVVGPDLIFGWAFFSFLCFALCLMVYLTIIPLYSSMSPAKYWFSNTSENMSIWVTYVCKLC